MKTKIVDSETISKNRSNLSADYYLEVYSKLKEPIKFNNPLNNLPNTIKLKLDDLDIDVKLLIYDLLKSKERLEEVRNLAGDIRKI